MTTAETIAANAAKGYVLVWAFDGFEIYKKQNEVGGWTYYNTQYSAQVGSLIIWDTAGSSNEELLALVIDMADSIKKLAKVNIERREEWDLWRKFVKLCREVVKGDYGGQVFVHCPNCEEKQEHTFPMSGKLYCVSCGTLIDECVSDT